jgi:hypothetical protein
MLADDASEKQTIEYGGPNDTDGEPGHDGLRDANGAIIPAASSADASSAPSASPSAQSSFSII